MPTETRWTPGGKSNEDACVAVVVPRTREPFRGERSCAFAHLRKDRFKARDRCR